MIFSARCRRDSAWSTAITARAHSHGVPPARFPSPVASAAATSSLARPGRCVRPESRCRRSPSGSRVRPPALVAPACRPTRPGPAVLARRAVGRGAHGGEQVGGHLVAVGGHPDALPAGEQVEDHPGSGVGLAAARRALHGEHRAVEPRSTAWRQPAELRPGQRGLPGQRSLTCSVETPGLRYAAGRV